MTVLLVPLTSPAQRFEDITSSSGIEFRHQASKTPRKYLPETMGGGVALLDFDSDGLLDIYFVNGARLSYPHVDGREPDKSDPKYWNRMYRNLGEGAFEDVTKELGLQGRGYGMGAAVGDYDNDSDPDLLVTATGAGDTPAAHLYRNEGGQRFTEVTVAANIDATGWATSAGFFDYDNDGDLDLFIARYMEWSFEQDNSCGMETTYGRTYCHPDLFERTPSLLYSNNGDGTFSNVSGPSAIVDFAGKGLGVAFADFDNDGFTDIAVANDSHPQFLLHNNGDGSFEETALFAGLAYDEDGREFAGMGVAAADLDDDGWTDIVTTTLSQQKYALFFNAGGEVFDYRTGTTNLGRITQLYSGWGVAAADFDNDGLRDLFFANGHVMDNIERSQPNLRYLQPPLLLRQQKGRFVDVSRQAGTVFESRRASRGAAVGDLNNDGQLDLVVANLDGPAYVALNRGGQGETPHWIGLDLEGCSSNRDGIAARVTLTDGEGGKRYATATRAGSYLSSQDPRVFFGLGKRSARSIRIVWPSGAEQRIDAPEINRILLVREPFDGSCRD